MANTINLFRVTIVYLLLLIGIVSYIPFTIQYATMEADGSFMFLPQQIEYAWLNPPAEHAGKMIIGVNWQRIYAEFVSITAIVCFSCIFSKNK